MSAASTSDDRVNLGAVFATGFASPAINPEAYL
jgi:hypothetical protein